MGSKLYFRPLSKINNFEPFVVPEAWISMLVFNFPLLSFKKKYSKVVSIN